MANKTGKGGFKENPKNINKAGAPKRGESWAEIIDRIGNMTPIEAAEHAKAIAGKLKSMGDAITLKEAVVIRGYASLLFEPTSSLMNVYMDRTDGKVTDNLNANVEQSIELIVKYATDNKSTKPTSKTS